MSIWSDLGGALSKGISRGIADKISGQKGVPAIAAIAPRILPAIGRVLGSPVLGAGTAGFALGRLSGGGAEGACPSGWHLAKDGSGRCVRNRRMNFGNARAARRSVRRLKGARKLLKDIEKMMPTKTRARRAPQHHHHPAAGG